MKASITNNGDEPRVDGDLTVSPAKRLRLLINLRALGDPEMLLAAIAEAGSAIDGVVEVRHAEAFRPSPPKPEMRL